MPRRATALIALTATLATAGCAKKLETPNLQGVCYHVVFQNGGKSAHFNEVVRNMPNLESCAAQLEGLRLTFMGRTGRSELSGAYNSSWLFLDREGVHVATTADGARYLALVRTGDGRLAIPGAMPQQ